MIGVSHEIARRIEDSLREMKPGLIELWRDTALDKSARLRFSSPLPGAVYTRLFDEFVDTLCDALARGELALAEDYWPDQAQAGRLSMHTPDEIDHLCATACRTISQAVASATKGTEDGPSVRCALERVLIRVRDGVDRAGPETIPAEAPPAGFDALVTAAEDIRQGLAWSELYDRDIRRSRRFESLRLMLIEIRGLSPAKAAESVLRRLYEELPCRICFLMRYMGRQRGVRLEAAWPGDQLGRELGEEVRLEPEALDRLPHALHGELLSVDHARGGLDAEVATFGARAMFVAPLPRGKEPAGWLVVGLDDAQALAADDVEFIETAAVLLGTALDNAILSVQLASTVNRLRDLIRAAPDPIVLLDSAGLVLDLSDAAAHVLGMSRSDLAQMNLSEKNAIGGRDELKAFLESAAAGPVTRLLNGRRPDGTIFRAACSVAALEDGSRVLVFRNITNVARAAEVHHEAKARYRALLDSAADVVFLLDMEGRCVDVGERALAAYGVDRSRVPGRTVGELLDEVTARHLLAACHQVIERDAPTTTETSLVTRGRELTFDVSLSPVHNATGNIVGVLGIARDVTDARRFEHEVRRVSALGASVVRAAPIGIAVLDKAGTIVTANDAMARLLRPGGTAAEAAAKKPVANKAVGDELIGLRLIGAESPLAAIAGELAQAVEGKPFSTRPFKHARPQAGQARWLSARGVCSDEEGMGERRVIVFVEDVSDLVRLQKELADSEKAAAASVLADLVHDLNTRLGPIIGHAQMLQHRKIGIGEMGHVNAIERCAQAVRRSLESLLAFSKPAAPTPRVCDVNAVIRDACAAVEHQYTARAIETRLELDEQLPTTLADGQQLAQVFRDTLGNAYEAIRGSGGRVTITTASTGAAITATVSDTGEAIDADELDRVFEPSYASERTKSGARLGLTAAQAIIRNHGGTITAASEPGRGITFRIELPIRSPAQARATHEPVRPLGSVRALRVLLIDPDDEMLAMMRKLLVGAGHRVIACAAAKTASDALRDAALDVIVADLDTPGLSGRDLHARLLADHPELAPRVVFTTADVCDARTSTFVHNTGCRLITKPFNVRDLLAAVAEVAAPGT